MRGLRAPGAWVMHSITHGKMGGCSLLEVFLQPTGEGCRPYLLKSDFARSGDMMIGMGVSVFLRSSQHKVDVSVGFIPTISVTERTGGTRIYCRWCAVGWC